MACFKFFICFKFHVKAKSGLTCCREESISNQTNRAMERATTLPKTPPGWLFLSLSLSCTTRGLLHAFHSARSRLWTSWYEEHLSRLVNRFIPVGTLCKEQLGSLGRAKWPASSSAGGAAGKGLWQQQEVSSRATHSVAAGARPPLQSCVCRRQSFPDLAKLRDHLPQEQRSSSCYLLANKLANW